MAIHQEMLGITVIGISGIVTNDDPAAIGALWGAFRGRDLRAQLCDEMSREVYCVYHDYKGGFMDPYRMTIGYRAPNEMAAPDGLHSVDIPNQQMVAYDVKGPMPDSLITQWQAIWSGELNRSYRADFDVYDADDAEKVTVYVGVNAA